MLILKKITYLCIRILQLHPSERKSVLFNPTNLEKNYNPDTVTPYFFTPMLTLTPGTPHY